MNTIAIIQCRFASSRLPGKALLDLGGYPTLHHVITRTRRAVPDVVLATTEEPADDAVAAIGHSLQVPVVRYGRGAEVNNVFVRFRKVLEQRPCDVFIRVTADCPLVEPVLLWTVVQQMNDVYDKAGRTPVLIDGSMSAGFADGLDCEAVWSDTFCEVKPSTLLPDEQEHVTRFFRKFGYLLERQLAVEQSARLRFGVTARTVDDLLRITASNLSWGPTSCMRLTGSLVEPYRRDPRRYRLTLDTQRDYERLQRIWAECPLHDGSPSALDALEWLERHPEWWGMQMAEKWDKEVWATLAGTYFAWRKSLKSTLVGDYDSVIDMEAETGHFGLHAYSGHPDDSFEVQLSVEDVRELAQILSDWADGKL